MPNLAPSGTLSRSATDFIKSSLRLVGALRSGMNLSGGELTDCQQVLNDMLDAFSVERVLIPAETVQSFDQNQKSLALVGGQQAYKIGNVNGNEDFPITRPARISRISVFYSASQSTPAEVPMEMYDSLQWQSIANKTTTSLLPQVCFVDESNAVFPDMIAYFWPVPTQANPVTLYLWGVLQQFADLTAKFIFPPAYAEMLRYNLAVRLAAEFPCDMTKFPLVKELASSSYGRVTGINVRPLEAVSGRRAAQQWRPGQHLHRHGKPQKLTMRFGFVGPAYASPSPLADGEALINWRPQKVESPNARTPYLLLPTSGLKLFATLGPGLNLPSVRGFCITSGRTFAVAGTHLFEIAASGVVTDYGASTGSINNNIVDDLLPATIVESGTVGGIYPSQIQIASGGNQIVISLATSSFQALTTPPTAVLMVDNLDGFFIALSAGNSWSVSNAEDATTWPGIAVTQVQVFSDQLLSLIAANRLLCVFGAKRAVFYYNSGAPLFPFDVESGGFMEVGIVAQYSPQRVATHAGTTIMWLGGDERGQGVVYAANGFIPQRVSDSGLEYWLSQQKTISDAVGMARQEEGQNFYDLWFPSSNTTWSLDVDLGWWHMRSSTVKGAPGAHLGRCHAVSFGTHLVGDRISTISTAASSNYLTDNGTPIVRT